MYQYDFNEVSRLTGFSAETRESLSRYYAKLPEPVRIEAYKIQSDLVRQARTEKTQGREPEFFYAQFLIALHKMRSMETGPRTHGKEGLTPEELSKIELIRKGRIRMEHRKKPRPTRRVVEIRFYETIEKFRAEGISWRDISKYIGRFHRCKISHSYLKECFEQISAERKVGKETV
jgi:hypothetical protein